MTIRPTRRQFLQSTAAAIGAPLILPSLSSLRGANEQLNIAIIGCRNRGWDNVQGVRHENIYAICDVDLNYLGAAGAEFPKARRFRDYRRMLDALPEIDAVVISTPDHHHAPAAKRAIDRGKHCYCEKPLTHTVAEARTLANLAKEHNVATQMGTQIHAENNYRRVVELIQSGAIGPVREAHCWSNKHHSDGRFGEAVAPPAHLDWNLWLGPAPTRPYCEGIHPGTWRRFWEYGTGTLGDMGCHYMDLLHWALRLRHPDRVETTGPEPHDVGTPDGVIVHYSHRAREHSDDQVAIPACDVYWYDGDHRPERLAELTLKDGTPIEWGDGHLFVGEKGMLLSDYSRYVLLPQEDFEGFTPPQPWIADSIGHYREWTEAIRSGSHETTCNFDYSGALTEAVLLGNVAFRAQTPIEWDGAGMTVTNSDEANAFVSKEYHKGWEV